MDAAEKLVEKLLTQLGVKDIRYEPNGPSTFPDFACDSRVAVEVRRLNQNHEINGVMRGLEEDSIPISHGVARLCASLGSSEESSWYVTFSMRRPVTPWTQLKPKLALALRAFKNARDRKGGVLYADRSFTLQVAESSTSMDTFLRLVAMSDGQAGGWVVAEFLKNIKHCIRVKTQRLAVCPVNYAASWLILVNATGLRMSDDDVAELREHACLPAEWERIIVVGASDAPWFELGHRPINEEF